MFKNVVNESAIQCANIFGFGQEAFSHNHGVLDLCTRVCERVCVVDYTGLRHDMGHEDVCIFCCNDYCLVVVNRKSQKNKPMLYVDNSCCICIIVLY